MPGFNPMDVTTKRVLKKLGGDKKSYSMSYDGKIDDKVTIPLADKVYFVKVSNMVLTKEKLIGATYVGLDKSTITLTDLDVFDNSVVGVSTPFYLVMDKITSDAPSVISCKACTVQFNGANVVVPSDGTYFLCMAIGDGMYVSSLSNETIVPIDQKYLGGVCLPVVELSTEFAGAETVFSESDNALLSAVAEKQTPIILKMPMGGGSVMCVCNALVGMGFLFYTDMTYMLTSMDGSWSVMEA